MKGVAFHTVMAVLAEVRSGGAVAASLACVPAELGEAFRYGTIITAGWYPVAWYRALWSAIRLATGEGQDLARELGSAAIDHDFNGLYRAMFRMLSPRTLVTTGLKHFSHIYDTGSVEVIESRDAVVRVRWRGCTGFDRNMWIEIMGSCERLSELAGAKSPRGTIQDGGDGESCVALFRWR